MNPPPPGRPILVTIRPLHEETGVRHHGRFCVYNYGRRLCISGNPIRDTGRGFLHACTPPETLLVARHDPGGWDVVTTTVGAAAQGISLEGENIVSFRDKAAARREARRREIRFSRPPRF